MQMVRSDVEYMNRKERRRFFRECGRNKDTALYTRRLRVKVYARVSTAHESQINALQNQLKWYLDKIAPNWDFDPKNDMYIDEGITGTSAKKREGFLSMIEDAKSDNCDFDIIITREVCRFARNIEETFKYTRELKEVGIGVLFICDDIWSFDDSTDGILKLSIMASLAQSESKKVSERSSAGQEVSRRNGQPYGNGNILGYDKVHHKKNRDIDPATGLPYKTTFTYQINEVQAETVRRIFELCLQGVGLKRTQIILKQEGRLTATGQTDWDCTNISRVLNNPTYMGYNAYGKSKVVDYLSHEKEYERDLDKLELVKGDWEPIISEEDWYLAKAERDKRRVVMPTGEGVCSKFGIISAENMWLRKLKCQCGSGMHRYKWRKNSLSNEQIYGYTCYRQISGGSKKFREKNSIPLDGVCKTQSVQECKLDMMAKRIFEAIWKDRKEAMELAFEMIANCYEDSTTNNDHEIRRLEKAIQEEEEKKVNVAMKAAEGLFGSDESIVEKVLGEYDKKIVAYNYRLQQLKNEQESKFDKDVFHAQIKDALATEIDFSTPIISYDVVDCFVNKIICCENSEFLWILDFDKMNNLKPLERISPRYMHLLKTEVKDEDYDIFLEFELSFEECQEYMKSRGRRIVERGWNAIKVKVALAKQ